MLPCSIKIQVQEWSKIIFHFDCFSKGGKIVKYFCTTKVGELGSISSTIWCRKQMPWQTEFHQQNCTQLYQCTYCNYCVLSLTHMLILNVCLKTSMHSSDMSTQHLNETLDPVKWIRVCPSHRNEHSGKRSHVPYCVSCNICKYMTFKPHTHPSFGIYIPSTSSHLTHN